MIRIQVNQVCVDVERHHKGAMAIVSCDLASQGNRTIALNTESVIEMRRQLVCMREALDLAIAKIGQEIDGR